jgi:hypothetical protein
MTPEKNLQIVKVGWLTDKSKINRSYFQMLEKQKLVLRGYLPLIIAFASL